MFKLGNGHFCPLRYQGLEYAQIPQVYYPAISKSYLQNFFYNDGFFPGSPINLAKIPNFWEWTWFISEGFLLISMGKKNFFALFFMLLLVEGEEKECLPKFGVPIFILAHKLNKFYWKHCT